KKRPLRQHDPEKWTPVFRIDHAQTRISERDDGKSSRSERPFLFESSTVSGVVAAAIVVAAEIVAVHVHLVAIIVVVRGLVEQSGARIVAAIGAASDVVDA